MGRKPKTDKVKQLIDTGKEKGVLTYEEVNDVLPSDMVSPEKIDELMTMFGEMDIEIVESSQSTGTPKRKSEKRELAEKDLFGKMNDPVRMYLKEMGSVSLLSREEEVEIAKRIEVGEREVLEVVLSSPITIQKIFMLGDMLKKEQLQIREIVDDLDDEENEIDEEHYINVFLGQLEKIKKLCQDNARIEKRLATQKDFSETRKRNHKQKIDKNRSALFELLKSLNLKKVHRENIVGTLRGFLKEIETSERYIERRCKKVGMF